MVRTRRMRQPGTRCPASPSRRRGLMELRAGRGPACASPGDRAAAGRRRTAAAGHRAARRQWRSRRAVAFRSSSTSGNRRRQLRSTGTRTQAVIVSAQAMRMRPPAPAATLRPAITARSAAASAIRASATAAIPAAVGLLPRGKRSMTGVPSSCASTPRLRRNQQPLPALRPASVPVRPRYQRGTDAPVQDHEVIVGPGGTAAQARIARGGGGTGNHRPFGEITMFRTDRGACFPPAAEPRPYGAASEPADRRGAEVREVVLGP